MLMENATKLVNDCIKRLGLDDDIHIVPNTVTRNIAIEGNKDGFRYTTNILSKEGNIAKKYIEEQVMKLYNLGLTQNEIAKKLSISQSSVSIYIRASKKCNN